MSIINTIQDWIIGKAIVRAIASAAKLIVSFTIAHGISLVATVHGVNIDLQNEGIMTVALNSGFKVVTDYLKHRYPDKFGWL